MIDPDMEDLKAGTLHIGCPSMTLSNRDEEDRTEFNGPGEIRFDDDGQLEVVLYDQVYETDVIDFPSRSAGSWVPSSELFDLKATDWFGAEWTAENLRPDPYYYLGRPGAVVRVHLDRISKESEVKRRENDYVWLFFSERIDTPTNVSTVTTVQEGTREIRKGARDDVWEINGEGPEEITLRRRDSGFEINVVAESGCMESGLDTRIEEAVWFTLGHPLTADIVQYQQGDREGIVIYSRGRQERARSPVPPYHVRMADSAKPLADVFCKYLRYIRTENRERYHPLSVLVRNMLRASNLTTDEFTLTVCVSVEGILGLGFDGLGEPKPEDLIAVSELEDLLGDALAQSLIAERVKGLFKMIRRPSLRSALRVLAERGVISKEEMAAWEELRHPSAHGKEFDLPRRELYELSVRVRVLLNRLIFNLIGYTGKYTDYGTVGWPNRSVVEET